MYQTKRIDHLQQLFRVLSFIIKTKTNNATGIPKTSINCTDMQVSSLFKSRFRAKDSHPLGVRVTNFLSTSPGAK